MRHIKNDGKTAKNTASINVGDVRPAPQEGRGQEMGGEGGGGGKGYKLSGDINWQEEKEE